MGINSIPLSDRLKELEKYGLIQREALAETPPRVEYPLKRAVYPTLFLLY